MRKIGIFGGSFNPIHVGHALIASYIVENSDIDTLAPATWQELMKQAFDFAQCCAESDNNCVTQAFVAQKGKIQQ